jgi:predicted peptidase
MRSALFGALVMVLGSLTLPAAAQQAAAPAKGDQQRTYRFAEAGVEMPYRLYVPKGYDATRATPLVVALHGYGGDQDYFFKALPSLPALLDEHGFIFVAPMGFAKDGWYGAPLSIPGNAPRSSGAPTPTPARSPEEETRYRALSEADVLAVLALVQAEYNVDARRIYLLGHSMGGFGTWWLGQKHAERWAAIAALSGVLPNVDYQLPRLKNVPVHISIGGKENPEWVAASRQQAETMRGLGMTVGYFEPAEETHGSMIAPTLPQALAFFVGKARR